MDGPQDTGDGPDTVAVVQRRRWPRLLGLALLVLLAVLVVAIAVLWTQRRPIASDILAREFDRRGVQATYSLDRVGLRTQQVSNLVIGDPANPDLTARFAQVQMRILWNGRVEIYRVVARGVRLRGRVADGRVSWGQVDRLLPPPSGKPFSLPDITVDLADTAISLSTPFGPLGVAVEGAGNLTGGFRGRLAAASPRLDPGRCALTGMRAAMGIAIRARRPQVTGPLSAESFACPASNIAVAEPRFDVDVRFTEAFERFTGRARMSAAGVRAGVNELAGMNGMVTFAGEPTRVLGSIDLTANGARLADITAERTRLDGSYLLNAAKGQITLVSDYAAEGVDLAENLTAPLTGALTGAAETPVGPLVDSLRRALTAATRDMAAQGSLRLVNFAGGGAVRVETANVRSASGARIRVAGGDGITYYWPQGRIRIDGTIEAEGGGLPMTRVAVSQPRSGGPMSGVAQIAPYAAGGARLSLAPIRFASQRDGSVAIQTAALLDGPLSGGQVRGLRVPLNGRFGPGGALEFGRGCNPLSFTSLELGALQLGRTSIPVCATGRAILFKQPDGDLAIRAFSNRFALNGRLGSSPFALRAGRAAMTGSRSFDFDQLAVRMGRDEAPILLNAADLKGSFQGSGISGTFAGADGVIGRVPIALSEMSGDWLFYQSRLSIDGALTASDIGAEPARFYPLRSTDMEFLLADDRITASGSLRHPASGALVTNVSIQHRLSSGEGGAVLDVPGLDFRLGGLQPEQITRLTEGVVALVNGRVTGQGLINWSGEGEVTSTGEFSTQGMDLAAAFGPVQGLSGTIRFTDLLGLETAPGQQVQVASINPGILVENGVITYQLLPGQLVRIQGGRWPFMGGELILRETILNVGRPSAKRLTFEVVGLDANQFVQSFGFSELTAEGVFDGVLPMIFDENGGRIVGGRLDSRSPGGRLAYNGEVNLGTVGNIAFNALKDLRFRSMVIRLDGDLAGEFGTRIAIDGVALAGSTRTQRFIQSALSDIPIRLNLNIRGPFRALIAMASSMRDPRSLISTTFEIPLEGVPGITSEVRRREEETSQTQTPVEETVTPTTTPTTTR